MTDINLNAAECIRTQENIGNTAYHNICSGVTQIVPWGSADWVGNIVFLCLLIFVIALFAMLGVMLYKTVTDTY